MKRFLKMVGCLTLVLTLLACASASAMTTLDYYNLFMGISDAYVKEYTQYYSDLYDDPTMCPPTGSGYNQPTYTCTFCNGTGHYQTLETGIGHSYYLERVCPLCYGRGYY